MQYTTTIADAALDALSAQFASRTPRAVDGDGDPTETAAEHVTRALDDFLASETTAAQMRAAQDAIASATTDAERKDALLAEYKMREQRLAVSR